MTTKLSLLSLAFVLLQCSQRIEGTLSDDPIVDEIFTPAEVRDLQKALDFFEDQICLQSAGSEVNIRDCYQSFFNSMKDWATNGEMTVNISFDEQRRLYQQMDTSTFNSIWTFNKKIRSSSRDTLKILDFKYGGHYAKFLEKYGQESPVIADYYDSFQYAGGISPGMIVILIYDAEALDISQAAIRLFIAIHYLTSNDQNNRNEAY
ncbi:hypothetical protein [uncultured Imperialibacter sp.]|uniref:hypothetical protein n=1 Tax=uncultured Imperialibacter sp. TaxID=1672639 RepID=UPI0030DDC741|tara:strand:- start:143 stop:760 length:618 start_codon:yes stop_codon:yes gene_type:complete